MQFRQLRYFVKIVDAGSFSRAAAIIHVAQPALSQQIAELEERFGVSLLLRSARGVRPTPAGEVLYQEATSILRQIEQLPGIIRSTSGEIDGPVSLGLASTIAAMMAASFIEACRSELPKVALRYSDVDSEALKSRVESGSLDMAVVFEDELTVNFFRKPLFRQRLYLMQALPSPLAADSISLAQLAELPLILPGQPNDRRGLIDRAFSRASLKPNIIADVDSLHTELSMVRQGMGSTILPTGNKPDLYGDGFAEPVLVEPALVMTCSIISSADFPLTRAGEALRNLLIKFIEDRMRRPDVRGVEWIR